ncbi:MAG: hypothetical protein ACOYOQ_15785, partial [Microthrixaceae bacterium]
YDPATGEFLQLDPKVDDTNEPYLYAGGSPVDHVDPDGEWPKWVDAGARKLKKAGKWVADTAYEYRNEIMLVAAIGAAIGCSVATFGVGAPACVAIAAGATVAFSAATNSYGAATGKQSWGDAGKAVAIDAALSAIVFVPGGATARATAVGCTKAEVRAAGLAANTLSIGVAAGPAAGAVKDRRDKDRRSNNPAAPTPAAPTYSSGGGGSGYGALYGGSYAVK